MAGAQDQLIDIFNRLAKIESEQIRITEKLTAIADSTEWLEDFSESDEGKEFATDMLNAFQLLTTHMPAIKKGLQAVGGALAADDVPAEPETIEAGDIPKPVAVEG